MNFINDVFFRIVQVMQDANTALLIILLISISLVLLFLVVYLFSLKRFLTDESDFFKRRVKEMQNDGSVSKTEVYLVPVIHGKKSIIPLQKGELLHFYQRCQYFFFPLNANVRNVNIDLLISEKEALSDFDIVGNGKLFFTSKEMVFENVRSRNQIQYSDITELKIKFDHIVIFDSEGCHAFKLESPEVVSNFIYNIFLKEI